MQEQELFKGYEIKNWEVSPRLYKIFAASAVLNIVAILGFAQSNLLTTKGCESPLVGKVCEVIDTLIVGGSVLTTDTEYSNKDYDVTEIADADIIWVDQTGVEKFQYPADYAGFSRPEPVLSEIPNPDGTFPTYIPVMPPPGSTSSGTNDLLIKPQELPKQNDQAVVGPLPDKPFDFGDNPTTRKGKTPKPRPYKTPKNNTAALNNDSPNNLPNLDAKPTPDPTKAVADFEINKKPMQDFAKVVKTKFDKNEIDLTQNFKIAAEGYLTKDGRLDVSIDPKTKKPRFQIIGAEGNEQMIDVVKQAIAAVGDSGWLGYLRTQGIEKINFTVVQDNDNVQIMITSDLATPERAKSVTSGVNGAMQGALFADANNIKKIGDDEKVLLSNAKTAINPQNTKQFVLNFLIPKPVAQEMITRRLKEAKDESKDEKPNGSTAQMKDSNQKAGK